MDFGPCICLTGTENCESDFVFLLRQ